MSYMTSYMTWQLFDRHHNFGIWHRVSECRCYDVICRFYDIVCRCYDVICRCYDVVCRCYDVTCVYDITYNSMGPLISRIAWFQVQCFGIVPAAARAQSQGERWLTVDVARGQARGGLWPGGLWLIWRWLWRTTGFNPNTGATRICSDDPLWLLSGEGTRHEGLYEGLTFCGPGYIYLPDFLFSSPIFWLFRCWKMWKPPV